MKYEHLPFHFLIVQTIHHTDSFNVLITKDDISNNKVKDRLYK
jgi:hypothetical protein